MIFWIKKLISAFLLPLPLGLILIALGIMLLILRETKRSGIVSLVCGFFMLMLFSFPAVPHVLLNRLQYQYTPLMQLPAEVNRVVVLGGGVSGGKNYPPNLTLSSASLSRLVEGIRLFKQLQTTHPQAVLILSGGRVFQSPAVAGKMRNTAVMLGIDRQNISLEDGSRDTHEEVLFLQKILGTTPFILVTSAYHMPRSMALFEHEGMHPIPAPTQFYCLCNQSFLNYLPNANNLILSDIAIHEYMGMWWGKILGYIQ